MPSRPLSPPPLCVSLLFNNSKHCVWNYEHFPSESDTCDHVLREFVSADRRGVTVGRSHLEEGRLGPEGSGRPRRVLEPTDRATPSDGEPARLPRVRVPG
ncbi:hypothetical protein SGPA1_10223 [Streptomyces misionensis JCM 4497]